jgi:hypothetical protein
MEPVVLSPDAARAITVKEQLVGINREVCTWAIENGLLLKEARDNGYHKEWGYDTFDHAIDALQNQGLIDYGPRNARNFILVVEMIQKQGLDQAAIAKIPISKLREIASLKSPKDQHLLLEACATSNVAEIQRMAKRLRAEAAGEDVDPLSPVTIMLTETMRAFYKTCLQKARDIYTLDLAVPDAAVLVDAILPEWFNTTGADHGQAVDRESDQEQGRPSPAVARQEGQEDPGEETR